MQKSYKQEDSTMKQNDQWLKYLDVYGCDLTRWPETPSSNDIKTIMAMPEYKSMNEMETALFQVEWPAPSKHLKSSTLNAIRQQTMSDVLVMEEDSRNGLWLQIACFVIFLGLGLTVGSYYTDHYSEQSDYSYFSVGTAYGY